MKKESPDFKDRVLAVVASIPRGRVMTYGQIAALCGSPRAARIVGGIAHTADQTLPWQRVVNKQGGMAVGYPGGVAGHQQHLEQEGVVFTNGHIKLEQYLWQPPAI
jgi:methylated-DNA-protein-cysteine methyltransferase related protein